MYKRTGMKKAFTLSLLLLSVFPWCRVEVDFAVTDIFTGSDGFIRIELASKYPTPVLRTKKYMENVFLIFSLNHTLRAEYKVKHMPASIFETPGKTVFVTHFRQTETVLARAEILLPQGFSETRKDDNGFEKQLRYE